MPDRKVRAMMLTVVQLHKSLYLSRWLPPLDYATNKPHQQRIGRNTCC